MKKQIQLIAALTAATSVASAAVIKIDGTNGIATVDGSSRLVIDSSKTLSSANEYILTEITYVTGGTLTIEKGTVIRGEQKSDGNNDPGALIITRAAQIDAQGTASEPIIFTTAALDNNSNGLPDRVGGNDANGAAAFVDWSSVTDVFLDAAPLTNPLPPYLGWDSAARYTPPADIIEYRGMWGGLVILGSAPTSISEIDTSDALNPILGPTTKADGLEAPSQLDEIYEGYVEGIAPSVSGEFGIYGGRNPHDTSGKLRFVSIRHGGSDIGDGNEINGLTMGGVGSGTLIEFIEVYCNADDGYEWFGGTVNARYLVSLFNNDDSFDMDEGYQGLGQFWFSLQLDDNKNGDHAAEHDGTDALFESTPVAGIDTVEGDNGGGIQLAHATIYNATYIGAGASQTDTPDSGSNTGFRLRDSWGGGYYNSIITDFGGWAIRVDADNEGRWAAGDVSFKSNIFYNFAQDTGTYDVTPTAAELGKEGASSRSEEPFANTGDNFSDNVIDVDPFDSRRNGIAGGFGSPGIPAKFDRRAGLDPRPDGGVAAVTSNLEDELASFFVNVSFKGAFSPTASSLWTDGWSAAAGLGVLSKQ